MSAAVCADVSRDGVILRWCAMSDPFDEVAFDWCDEVDAYSWCEVTR